MVNYKKMLMGAAGAGGAEPQPIQNIFRQYSYIGNRQSRNFNTGIDLLTDGGCFGIKGYREIMLQVVMFYPFRIYRIICGIQRVIRVHILIRTINLQTT